MQEKTKRVMVILLVAFGLASLVHFIHNAEFLSYYPGLPKGWTRGGVYGVWVAMTVAGIVGWSLLQTRFQRLGLIVIAGYALTGLDSLGHYLLAPLSAHNTSMNLTILVEVFCAFLLFSFTAWQFIQTTRSRAAR